MKKLIAIVLTVLLISMLAACAEGKTNQEPEKEGITQQKASQIAVADAGHTVNEVTGLHTHEHKQDDYVIYEIHFSCGEESYTYQIHGETGEILSKNP